MDSNQQFAYQNPVYLPPFIQPVKYEGEQQQSYQIQEIYSSTPETYVTNTAQFSEYETTKGYNQENNNFNDYNQDNSLKQINQGYIFDFNNQVDIINANNTQYDITNINTNEYNNQIDLNAQYQYDNTNIYNYENQSNLYTPIQTIEATNQINQANSENQINQITYYTNNSNNIVNQPNEVLTENQTSLQNKPVSLEKNIPNKIINKQSEIKQISSENPLISVDFSLANDKSGVNKINKIYTGDSSNLNVLQSIDTVKSEKRSELNDLAKSEFNYNNENEPLEENEPRIIDSPRLINPLNSPIPQKENLINNKIIQSEPQQSIQLNEENKIGSNILTKDEKILLKNENFLISKDFNIQSHFDLSLIKEPYGFNYEKLHKVGIPLLAHFEMPHNCIYTSPILSSNGKYLSCIAHGPQDFVYVWDINDLYWYKYKFSSSRVDGISFTPDSKSIIIVYRFSNPIMYDLSNGKNLLEFERNGEENNREGFQCTFTTTGTHFAYTTDKSFTLWSLRTGKIKHQIVDDSPIKIICGEFLICIDKDLNVLIKKISNQEDVISFILKGVESPEEIMDAKCTKDMSTFIYVIKQGIIKYIFKDREYKGIQKFLCGVEKAKISEDCKYILKTNMKNISIYDLEKKESICTILKDKFKDFRIDFELKKLIVIDDISINIQNIEDDSSPKKYVWLDKNPTKFEEVKFSRDFKVLLARVNRNNAVAYDLNSGYIVKKWQNIDENWLDFAMTKYGGDKIATKSHLLLIKVWNFTTGREEASFYGYDSYSFCFSGSGAYLACGAKLGNEVARIWDIYNQKYGIFINEGTNNNFHTVVHLTSPEPKRLICCSINQTPLVFNTNTKELLFNCECPYRFEEIYGIQSDLLFNVFIVKGRDEQKRNVGVMYKISDGSLLETYENYSVLELAKNIGAVISKCENINGGKLTSTNIKNLNDPILNDFQIQTEKCQLLDDNKTAVIEYGDEFNKEYNLINVENATFIGKITFTKKNQRHSVAYLTLDKYEKEIYFRYFEFLSPQETMIYKKKNIFNVEVENSE